MEEISVVSSGNEESDALTEITDVADIDTETLATLISYGSDTEQAITPPETPAPVDPATNTIIDDVTSATHQGNSAQAPTLPTGHSSVANQSSEPSLQCPYPIPSTAVVTQNVPLDPRSRSTRDDLAPDDMGPPPTYEESTEVPLTYVDFAPQCVDDGGILTSPKFQPFSSLVVRANAWLLKYPRMRAQSFESVEYRIDQAETGYCVDTREAMFQGAHPESGGIVVKVLRMWIRPKNFVLDEIAPQRIGYLNVVPACLHPGGLRKTPTFDNLRDTVRKLNVMFRQKPLPGDLLCAETVATRFRQYGREWAQPDRCHWKDYPNDLSVTHLVFLRLYYQVGQPSQQSIEFKDFQPKILPESNSSRRSRKRKFEPFASVLAAANVWLKMNTPVDVLNFQTIHCKIKFLRDGQLRTNPTQSLNTNFQSPSLVQTLRLWHVIRDAPNPVFSIGPSVSNVDHVVSKLFCPNLAAEGASGVFAAPRIELLSETRERLTHWIKERAGMRVVSVETLLVKSHEWSAMCEGTDSQPMQIDDHPLGSAAEWFRGFRLYVEGHVTSVAQWSAMLGEVPPSEHGDANGPPPPLYTAGPRISGLCDATEPPTTQRGSQFPVPGGTSDTPLTQRDSQSPKQCAVM